MVPVHRALLAGLTLQFVLCSLACQIDLVGQFHLGVQLAQKDLMDHWHQ